MAMRRTNKFERHGSRTLEGIKISARSAKTAFASEGNEFELTAMFTTIKSKAVFGIATMNHFLEMK